MARSGFFTATKPALRAKAAGSTSDSWSPTSKSGRKRRKRRKKRRRRRRRRRRHTTT